MLRSHLFMAQSACKQNKTKFEKISEKSSKT